MINIPPLSAEKIFDLSGFPVTNSLLMSWLVLIVFGVLAFLIKRGFNIVPPKLQNFFEFLIEKLIENTEGIFGSRRAAEKYFPIVATIFLFVIFSNWLGLIPIVGPLGIYEMHEGHEVLVPLFRSASADLNFTIALAVTAVMAVNVFGIAAIGVFKHFGKFITFKNPVAFFVGILELISEVVRMLSFSFRLFGNVFAGEVMLVIAAGFLPYLLPLPLLVFEVFVGFIQAAVFAMLTAVFISMAINHHEEAH